MYRSSKHSMLHCRRHASKFLQRKGKLDFLGHYQLSPVRLGIWLSERFNPMRQIIPQFVSKYFFIVLSSRGQAVKFRCLPLWSGNRWLHSNQVRQVNSPYQLHNGSVSQLCPEIQISDNHFTCCHCESTVAMLNPLMLCHYSTRRKWICFQRNQHLNPTECLLCVV